MRRSASITLLLLAALSVTGSAHAAGWELVFEEQFDGAALDREVWATRYVYDNDRGDTFPANGERQRYRDEGNHVQHDGQLDLVAQRKQLDAEHEYASGLVRSYQTFYYGYFEARVKAPRAKGTWPAFWLAADRDRDGKIEHPPEIDIFDNANNGKDATSSMVWSGGVGGDKAGGIQNGKLLYRDEGLNDGEYKFYESGHDLTGAWHVYGMLWTPSTITMWLDGKRIYTREYKWVANDGTLAGPAHILFNLAVGGPWAGRFGIDDKAFPQALSIDYVRVCQLSTVGKGARTCGDSKVSPDPDTHAYRSPLASDLIRPTLFDARLSKSAVRAGDKVLITHKLSSSVSTTLKHSVYQYLVNDKGETIARSHVSPKIATTQWAGRNLSIPMPLAIPRDAAPGRYRIYVAIGTPLEWDPDGKEFLQALTLQYSSSSKHRDRIAQPVRYQVGSVVIR